MKYDLLIKNGTLISGGDEFFCRRGDLAVQEGRIAAVGDLFGDTGREEVEAGNLAVCPGFIDVHAHSELSVWQDGACLAKASQGITTELTGQCGISAYPVEQEAAAGIREYTQSVLGGTEQAWPWEDLAAYRREVEKQGMAINQGTFIGHGTLRINALGFAGRKTAAAELESMKNMLASALEEGAFGMSTGLVYAPGMFADIRELTELARVCAAYDGIYTTHMRNEGNRLLDAVAEAIEVGEVSGVQVNISHLKASGKPNHGKVRQALKLMEEAGARGLRISGDCYPYDASSTTMTIILPPWSMTGGIAGLLTILADKEKKQKILRDFREGLPGWDNRVVNLGYDRIFIGSAASGRNKNLEGLSLEEGARLRQQDPGEFVLDLLLEEKGQVTAILQGMAEEDVRTVLAHPRMMVCTDGVPVGRKPHPRLYGAFTRYLSRYADLATEEGITAAVRKLTALPAEVYGLKDVGYLLPGYRADITIFDPCRVKDQATFAEPQRLSEGIQRVIVGGETVLREKQPTGRTPGRFIRRR